MSFVRVFFTGVFCVLFACGAWADGPARQTNQRQSAGANGITTTTDTYVSGANAGGGVNSGPCKGLGPGKKCSQNIGTGTCVSTNNGGLTCMMTACKAEKGYYLEHFTKQVNRNGRESYRGGERRAWTYIDETNHANDQYISIGGSKGICRTLEGSARANKCQFGAALVTLDSGVQVIAGCKETDENLRKCQNGQILQGSECVPCPETCADTAENATCKLTGSDGLHKCMYETKCNPGYGDKEHGGKYTGAGTDHPKCTPNKYKITLNLNGGNGCKNEIHEFGKALTINCEPKKANHIFAGWSQSKNGDNIGTEITIPADDMVDRTYYAQWQQNSQSAPTTDPCANVDRDAIHATELGSDCKPIKCADGYFLDGGECKKCKACDPGAHATCNLRTDGVQCIYDTGCESEGYDLTDNQGEYNPICEPHKYTITLALNGGNGCGNIDHVYGTQTVITCKPARENHDFAGWSQSENGENIVTEITIPANDMEDRTYYAQWKPSDQSVPEQESDDDDNDEYEYTFDLGAEVEIHEGCVGGTYKENEKKTVKCNVTRRGYTLESWHLTDENGEIVNMPYPIPQGTTGGIKFYAKWKKDTPAAPIRTECKQTEKDQFPNADEFIFDNNECKPTHCKKGYKLKNGECVDNGVKEAEDKYNAAVDTEQSMGNRVLGGTTIAATGLGGMQLAQGLAEQAADRAAEEDMKAYIATFKCSIGEKGPKNYNGGTKGITTPVLTQFTDLYQDYKNTAGQLKIRKEALGMTPGIEAELVLEAKDTDSLYDDVGHGIENRTQASLYRSLTGDADDANALNDKKETSATRVKGGAAAVGAGVVGGVAGNLLINHNDSNDKVELDIDKAKELINQYGNKNITQ